MARHFTFQEREVLYRHNSGSCQKYTKHREPRSFPVNGYDVSISCESSYCVSNHRKTVSSTSKMVITSTATIVGTFDLRRRTRGRASSG